MRLPQGSRSVHNALLRSVPVRDREQVSSSDESRLALVPSLVATIGDDKRRVLALRVACWAFLLGLGAIQAWVVRFVMNPDGVSYLDMGDAYWRGDWHHAINAYWSPLYSWILGFFVKAFKPTPYWEYPLTHFVNFLIFVGVLACFDFFLATFIADRKRRDSQLSVSGRSGLSESSWWLLGYGLFACSSLVLIGLYRVSPDLCVAGLVYLASALIIKIRAGDARVPTYVFFGVVLGLAYLAKAAMFPLAFVFLAAAFFYAGRSRKHLVGMAISAAAFLILAAPLFAAISNQKGRVTFGESGAWNYALYVNRDGYWPSGSPELKHPVRQLTTQPPVYEFAEPVGGTFPPWYDPTYWHEGIKSHPDVRAEIRPIKASANVYGWIFFGFFLNAVLGLGLLYFVTGNAKAAIRRSLDDWAIAIPAIATLALYSLVHSEGRFVAGCVTVLFLVAYGGVQYSSRERARLARLVVAVVAAISILVVVVAPRRQWPVSVNVYAYPHPVPGPSLAEAATALGRAGVQPNDKIGLVWNEKWGSGAAQGAVVPRLLRLKIVSEMTDANAFWKLDSQTRDQAIETLRNTGIQAILARDVPTADQAGWARLGNTQYFAYFFPKSAPSPNAEAR
jgi:hypothetical protein